MQTGLSKGGKGGEANGSPTRMEQGEHQQQQRYMPHTIGAYDESLYRTSQQNPLIPPSTPSSGSRQQAQEGVSGGSPGVSVGCGCGG